MSTQTKSLNLISACYDESTATNHLKQVRQIFNAHANSGQSYNRKSRHSPKRTGNITHRKTVEFGYHFQKLIKGDKTKTPIPNPLQDIFSHARKALVQQNPDLDKTLPQAFDNCIISQQQTGGQLQAHIDTDVEIAKRKLKSADAKTSFYFGEDIIGVVLKTDPNASIYLQEFNKNEARKFSPQKALTLNEQAGTAFLLSGKNRHAPIYHGVTKTEKERISITFRTTHFLTKEGANAPYPEL